MATMSKGGRGPNAKFKGKGKGPKIGTGPSGGTPTAPRKPPVTSAPRPSNPFPPPTVGRGGGAAPPRAVPTARSMTTTPTGPKPPPKSRIRPMRGTKGPVTSSSDRFNYLPWNKK